jgi:hypothetical protein
MPAEAFIDRNFRGSSRIIIDAANAIISDYQQQGFTLTLRQLYYQFVSRDLIANKQSEYKRLGSIINDARLAGEIDWDAIEDRTRNRSVPPSWSSPQQIMQIVAEQYQEDPWRDQRWSPEVWIEKDALIGVVEPVCNRNRVPYFACRGYTSQSEAYAAGKRFAAARRRGKRPIVLHLGDHDPSGLDMTRDNADRLKMFAGQEVQVRRLALNMDQIQLYRPPPNPAKDTDIRFEKYQEEHGDESWELDALEPTVIDRLIQDELDTLIHREKWDEAMAAEEERKSVLAAMSDRYDDIVDFLNPDTEED